VTFYPEISFNFQVRYRPEYTNSVWNPHRQGQMKDLEELQMRASRLVMTDKHLAHKLRLELND